MYSLSEKDRLNIVSQAASCKKHPDGAVEIEIEQMIASTLPPVQGMVRGLSAVERVKVLAAAAQQQREKFINEHGDAFGFDQENAL